jgi:hypothetical protein
MSYRPSAESTLNPSNLGTVLARLGLSQYEDSLRKNGFEDWETILAITETDMIELGFRLGDRRRLQRAIRECRSSRAVLVDGGAKSLPVTSEELPETGESSEATSQFPQQAARTTRRYRRHPRPDPNTPLKPKTAYVRFGEHVRQDPASSHLSFTEIAKETGKRWRGLPDAERANIWEKPAADRLQVYKEKLEYYKQTEDYWSYQTYLEEFEQQRHVTESKAPSDDKASSAPQLIPSSRPLIWQGQDGLEPSLQERVDAEDINLEELSQATTSPVKCGMKEVRRIFEALGVSSHQIRVAAFPPEDMTTQAVEAFLHGTGSLLYLWSQAEILNLVGSVYHPQSDSKAVDTVEVFAMSAVGSYCDSNAHTSMHQEKFLHLFLHTLVLHLDMSNLRRMRLFACLAICRFTNSAESARELMRKCLMYP